VAEGNLWRKATCSAQQHPPPLHRNIAMFVLPAAGASTLLEQRTWRGMERRQGILGNLANDDLRWLVGRKRLRFSFLDGEDDAPPLPLPA
jgi:hypothetical protein